MADEKNTTEGGKVRKEATGKTPTNNTPPVTEPLVTTPPPPVKETPPVPNTTVTTPPVVADNTPPAVQLNEDEAAIIKGESTAIAPEQTVTANPLSQPVIERAHNQPSYPGDTVTPMKEPVLQPTQGPVQEVQPKDERTAQQQQEWEKSRTFAKEKLGEVEAGSAPANPAVALMSNKEKKDNLDMTVDTAIHYYSEGKLLICGLCQFQDAKLLNMEAKNELRADWAVLKDNSTNEILTLRQFLRETNHQMMEAGKTTDEFKEKLRGPLRAELDRRGLIASPENNLMLLAGFDLFMMIKNLYTINSSVNETIKRVKEEYKDVREHGYISDRQLYNQNMNRRMPEQVIIREVVREAAPPAPPVTAETTQAQPPATEAEVKTNDDTVFEPPVRKKKGKAEEAVA